MNTWSVVDSFFLWNKLNGKQKKFNDSIFITNASNSTINSYKIIIFKNCRNNSTQDSLCDLNWIHLEKCHNFFWEITTKLNWLRWNSNGTWGIKPTDEIAFHTQQTLGEDQYLNISKNLAKACSLRCERSRLLLVKNNTRIMLLLPC